ncbi:MAG: MmgE/PrpD family protein [bacterium]
MPTTPVTAILSDFCRGIRYEDLPFEASEVAKHCLMDWLGVTIAGSSEPLAVMLRDEVLADGGVAQATLFGTGQRVTAKQAALVNGAASHALDFDDVHLAMSGHPSVPIWPALLALAEWRGGSGRDVLTAFAAGYEMECRIGMLVMPSHYSTGFHSTGTLGAFGAAAACAHLLGFDSEQWGRTMGIAGAQAAGLKSMFGTMCKPLHAGKAATNGLFAALMAERGFTSNPEVLETVQGFAATQSSGPNVERALAGLGDHYCVRDTLFKYYAACYGTHESINGVFYIKDDHKLRPEDIDRIDLVVPEGHLLMCNIEQPATGLEGKFSLRYAASLAMFEMDAAESRFTNEYVKREDIGAMMQRVHVTPQTGDWERGTRVTVRTRSGATYEEQVNLNIPATDLQDQEAALNSKFVSLTEGLLGRRDAQKLAEQIMILEEEPEVGQMLALATSGSKVA